MQELNPKLGCTTPFLPQSSGIIREEWLEWGFTQVSEEARSFIGSKAKCRFHGDNCPE